MARDRKPFVAPTDGKTPRFSFGQKLMMWAGAAVVLGGVVLDIASKGGH